MERIKGEVVGVAGANASVLDLAPSRSGWDVIRNATVDESHTGLFLRELFEADRGAGGRKAG